MIFLKKKTVHEDIEQLKKIEELIINHFGKAAIDNTPLHKATGVGPANLPIMYNSR